MEGFFFLQCKEPSCCVRKDGGGGASAETDVRQSATRLQLETETFAIQSGLVQIELFVAFTS